MGSLSFFNFCIHRFSYATGDLSRNFEVQDIASVNLSRVCEIMEGEHNTDEPLFPELFAQFSRITNCHCPAF